MTGKRRLMAVLEADVVGYSTLVALDEVGTSRLLAESRKRFEEAARKHRGKLAVQTGDAFLLTFPSALDAVQAALWLHRRHRNRPLTLKGSRRLDFRIGIDLGDVWQDEHGHLAGNAVNTSARLEAVADAGGVCVSEVVHGQVRGRVGVTFEDMGPLTLKNLPAPVRAFKAAVYTVTPARAKALPKEAAKLPASRPSRPGAAPAAAAAAGRARPEQDWNRFVRGAYDMIQSRFKRQLGSLRGRHVKVDFKRVHERMFRCRVIVHGREEAQAKIWLGRMRGDREHICYANHDVLFEGEDSWNIALNPARNREAPALWATGSPLGPHSGEYDLQGLTPEDATDYLWRHFIIPLETRAE